MDVTGILALITALAAIVPPLLTSLINNHNNIKLKEIEVKENRIERVEYHEREVLEKALSGLGNLMSFMDREIVKESSQNILRAVAYVDLNTGEQLRKAVCAVMNHDIKISDEEYIEMCKALKQEIQIRTTKITE